MNTEELLEKNRYINVEFDWWDDEYDYFIGQMEAIGLSVDAGDIKFTGFYSQGDGASFEGRIHNSNLRLFMEQHKIAEQYEATYNMAKLGQVDIRLVRSLSHYCHEYTINLDIEDQGTYGGDSIREAVFDAAYEVYQQELPKFEEEVLKICRNYMSSLYGELRNQFDYLTSDKEVLACLEANNRYVSPPLVA